MRNERRSEFEGFNDIPESWLCSGEDGAKAEAM